MQVVENFSIRLQPARLMIGERTCLAKGLDDALCFTQVVARHTGEKVMLDLIIQSSVPEIGEGVGFHIACRLHLAMQKVQGAVLVQHRHPFVIGSEDRSQIQAGESLMDDYEQNGLPGGKAPEQETKVGQIVTQQKGHFNGVILLLPLHQEEHTVELQIYRGEQQDREEERGLILHQKQSELACTRKML